MRAAADAEAAAAVEAVRDARFAAEAVHAAADAEDAGEARSKACRFIQNPCAYAQGFFGITDNFRRIELIDID